MKKLCIALLVIALVSGNVLANIYEISEKAMIKIEESVDDMSKVMKLNNQQKAKVLEYKKVVYIKLTQLEPKYTKGTSEYKVARKAIQRNLSVMLKKICSREQIELWHEYRENKKNTTTN